MRPNHPNEQWAEGLSVKESNHPRAGSRAETIFTTVSGDSFVYCIKQNLIHYIGSVNKNQSIIVVVEQALTFTDLNIATGPALSDLMHVRNQERPFAFYRYRSIFIASNHFFVRLGINISTPNYYIFGRTGREAIVIIVPGSS